MTPSITTVVPILLSDVRSGNQIIRLFGVPDNDRIWVLSVVNYLSGSVARIGRFEAEGMGGLMDLRMAQVSSRRAPVDEVLGVVRLYGSDYAGWNVNHFHTWYEREHGGRRSYSWVKNVLQEAKLVVRSKERGNLPADPSHIW